MGRNYRLKSKSARISVYVPPGMKDLLSMLAVVQGTSVNTLVNMMVAKAVREGISEGLISVSDTNQPVNLYEAEQKQIIQELQQKMSCEIQNAKLNKANTSQCTDSGKSTNLEPNPLENSRIAV